MSAKAIAATFTCRCGRWKVPRCSPTTINHSACRRCFAASSPASWPHFRELTLFYAPNINSYKRFADRSFAPTVVAWGLDNRTCALRVVGHGDSMRVECRVPGGDVNQYLAVAALIAGGLHGVEHELPLPEPCAGNAYQRARGRRHRAVARYAGRSCDAVRCVSGRPAGIR